MDLVVSFSGSRGTDIPLLYFGAKSIEDRGAEKIFVRNVSDAKRFDWERLFAAAEAQLRGVDFSAYAQTYFLGKSIGTVVMCEMAKRLCPSAKLIVFTPLEETLPYLNRDNTLFIAAGTEDGYLSAEILERFCRENDLPLHREEGVGHRMEKKGKMQENLLILSRVMAALERRIDESASASP
ncbi:MAG: hypothetical protein ACI4U2_00205 [Christensenellaceae bacterium]